MKEFGAKEHFWQAHSYVNLDFFSFIVFLIMDR